MPCALSRVSVSYSQCPLHVSCHPTTTAEAIVTIETAKLVALPGLSLSRTTTTTTFKLSLNNEDGDDITLLNDKDVFSIYEVEMEKPTEAKPANLGLYGRTCWRRSRVHSLVDKVRALRALNDNGNPQIADILDKNGELRSSMSGFSDLLSALVIAKEADIAFILFSNLCSSG